MNNRLRDITVLITRQEKNADALVRQLEVHGIKSKCLPLFSIEPIISQLPMSDILTKLKNSVLSIVVSPNAAELLLPYISQDVTCRWATIGPGTAAYLRNHGVSNIIYPQRAPYDSQELLKQLIDCGLNLSKRFVTIFTGENGNHRLTEELQRCGATVEVLPVYRRVLPMVPMVRLREIFISQPAIDVILVSCVTSLQNLQRLTGNLPISIYNIPLLVVSDRIHRHAVDMGFSKVYTAKSVTEHDILAAILSWQAVN